MSQEKENFIKDERFIPEGLYRAPRILIVDDEEGIRKLLHFHLRRSGCEVQTAEDGESALALVEQGEGVDLMLLDLNLPGVSGLDTLRNIKATGKVGCTIVMTAFGTMNDAISALKDGAYDFVNKTHSFDELRTAVRNALLTVGLREEVEHLKMRISEMEGVFPDVIGVSAPFLQVMKLVRKVTDSDITVLILGESGTGKELIANAIHQQGQFNKQPFVALNCAAIPENLLESELFGHEKGSFTGATARRIGKFEEAHEGTLFLDEISELSPALQAKLLRVLQTQEIQPIGGRLRRVKVRIISATNQDLLQAAHNGSFREDLYYRLAVFPIVLPPLRERREDIPLLVDFFLHKFAHQENKTLKAVSPDVMERLESHPWFGNVRELENVIYRAVVLSESSRLTMEDFPGLPSGSLPPPHAQAEASQPSSAPGFVENTENAAMASSPPGWGGSTSPPPPPSEIPRSALPSGASLEDMEAGAIQRALAENSGNMSKAALQLGIGRATLYRKSKKYGLHRT